MRTLDLSAATKNRGASQSRLREASKKALAGVAPVKRRVFEIDANGIPHEETFQYDFLF